MLEKLSVVVVGVMGHVTTALVVLVVVLVALMVLTVALVVLVVFLLAFSLLLTRVPRMPCAWACGAGRTRGERQNRAVRGSRGCSRQRY